MQQAHRKKTLCEADGRRGTWEAEKSSFFWRDICVYVLRVPAEFLTSNLQLVSLKKNRIVDWSTVLCNTF